MAVDLAPGAAFSRATTGITAAPLTFCAWLRPDVLPGAGDYQSIWYHGTTAYSNSLELALYPDATIRLYDSTFTVRCDTGAVTIGAWIFVAFVVSGSDATLYWRTEGQTSLSSDPGTWSTTLSDQIMYWGSEPDPGGGPNTFDGALAFGRMFTSALTSTQILNESTHSNSPLAAWGEWPFGSTFGSDISGNGRRLTFAAGSGSGTVVVDPDLVLTPGEIGWVDGVDDAGRFDKWTFTVDSSQVSALNVVADQGEFTSPSGGGVDTSNLRDIYTLPETAPASAMLNCPGVSGAYASVPDAAVLDITGDLDVRFEITPADETPAAVQDVVSKYTTTGNQRAWKVTVLTTGALQLGWTTGGVTALFANSSTGAVRAGRWAYRVTIDVVSGTNRVITFYQAPRIAGPWTQIGSAVTQAGTTSIFNSTAPLTISGITNGTLEMFAGQVHAVEVRDGIDGTVVANPDFETQTVGATSFTDAAGRSWTINGQCEIVGAISETDGSADAHASTRIVCGPLFTSAVKPQHGIALRVQRDGSKWRAVVIWHDITFGIPHIINVGVWSANLDGTGFTNRQGNLWMSLGKTYTVTASSRTGNVVTLTMDPEDLVIGDRINVDVTGSLDATSVTLTNVGVSSVQYSQTGADVADGGTGTATRLFPYDLEVDLLGTVCRARAWDRTQTKPGWDDATRALSIDLDTDAAGDAAARAANPTPTGGRKALLTAHLGTNTDSRSVYGDSTFGDGALPSGSVTATLPALDADVAGAAQATGTLAATLPSPVAAAVGAAQAAGVLGQVLPAITADAQGAATASATLTAVLAPIIAVAAGVAATAGTIAAPLPALTSSATAAAINAGPLAPVLPGITAALIGSSADASGQLASLLPAMGASFDAAASSSGAATVALPAPTAALTGQATASAVLASLLPALAAAFAGGPAAVDTNPNHGTSREAGYGSAFAEAGYGSAFAEAGYHGSFREGA